MDAERALSADDRVWVEGAAGEDPVGIEALVARLRAAGLSLASSLDAGVTVIVRTRAAVSLAALLGSSPSVAQVARMGRASAVRWIDEDALARPRVGTPALAPADEPSCEALLSCAGDSDALDRELRRFRAPRLIALASELAASAGLGVTRCALALLRDARLTDRTSRARLARAVAAAPEPDALGWLAEAVSAHRGEAGHEEAVALGRLLAAGRTRWPARGPFAIEVDDPRDDAPGALLALLREAGTYERLHDARGGTVHRARMDFVPWIDDEASERSAPLRLLRAVSDLESARVWVGGVALPAALPWPLWCAVLGQRPGR